MDVDQGETSGAGRRSGGAGGHAGCRFWTARSDAALKALLREADECQTHDEAVAALRRRCCRAVADDDPEYLAAVLAVADRCTEASTDMRFAAAVASMEAGKYACAYVAWDDNGACWAKTSDDPWLPAGSHSASVRMRVCDEAREARRGAGAGGGASDLCRAMGRLNT